MNMVVNRLTRSALPLSVLLSVMLFQIPESGAGQWDAAMLAITVIIPAGALVSFGSLLQRVGSQLGWSHLWLRVPFTTLLIVGAITLSLIAFGGDLGFQGVIFAWLVIWFIVRRATRHLMTSAASR